MSALKNKLIAVPNKVRQRYNNFFNETNEQNKYNKIENFTKKYFITVSPTFEDYFNKNRPKKRKIITIFLRFVDILNVSSQPSYFSRIHFLHSTQLLIAFS